MSPWYHGVAERDHDLQNPTSREKIRLLGERMLLDAKSHVLDVASGRGGPALVLARELGCRLTCIERDAAFAEAARERAAAAGLSDLIEIVQGDARSADLGSGYDAALCLGASFVWDGLVGTLAALRKGVRAGGFLAVGEPYWRVWPPPPDVDGGGYLSLSGTVTRFEDCGIPVVSLIAAADDDWDRYESLKWRACEEWLAEHRDHPEAEELRRTYRSAKTGYLELERSMLGWAIFVGRLATG